MGKGAGTLDRPAEEEGAEELGPRLGFAAEDVLAFFLEMARVLDEQRQSPVRDVVDQPGDWIEVEYVPLPAPEFPALEPVSMPENTLEPLPPTPPGPDSASRGFMSVAASGRFQGNWLPSPSRLAGAYEPVFLHPHQTRVTRDPQDLPLIETEAKKFVLKLHSPNQMVNARVIFYIEAKPGQETPIYQESNFLIRVTTPMQVVLNVSTEKDRNRRRLICSFNTLVTGVHIISVCFGEDTEHIEASPTSVTIHQDSVRQPRGTVMTRILTTGRIDQDATGLELSGTSKIWGISSDPDTERIYAADSGGHEILVFCISRGQFALEAKFDAPVPADGRPFQPTGIHFCRVFKLVYVTDKDNHRVCIFETNGQLVMSFGSKGHQDGQFKYPWGVAVSPNGELIAVADSRDHRLQLFNKSGLFLRKYSVFEVNPHVYRHRLNGLDQPTGVCFNDTGSIVFISDFKLKTVISVDVQLQNRVTLFPLRRRHRPQGVTMNLFGNLLFCYCGAPGLGGGGIRIIQPDGTPGTTLESTINLFQMPYDVTVCSGGLLCVVDSGGTRLQII